MSIEDIVEEIQGIFMPQRSQRYQDQIRAAERYFELLNSNLPSNPLELAKVKENLDALSAPFSNNPVHQAMLNVERLTKLGDKNQ